MDKIFLSPFEVVPAVIDGIKVWTLRPFKIDDSWMGSLSIYGKGKTHDMNSIRESIAKKKDFSK